VPDDAATFRGIRSLSPVVRLQQELTMTDQPLNVLFLCTGNSARSILAECLVNHLGRERFRGYSAGGHPKGKVQPLTIHELQRHGLPTDGLRSKDMAEFEGPGVPQMHFR
jgi:arsenate reductase (thioredoxin)